MKAIARKFYGRNVYAKTMASFALVLCIVSAVVLPFSYQSERMLRQQHVEAMLSRMDEYLTAFEREYQMVSTQVLNLFLEDDVFELSQRVEIDYKWATILSIREVKRKITQIAEGSTYVDEIIVYLPLQNREVTSEFYYEPMDAELYHSLLTDSINGQKRFVQVDGEIYTCYAKTTRHGSEKYNDYMLAIRWHSSLIRDSLSDLVMSEERAGAAFVGNQFGGLSMDDGQEWMDQYRYGEIHIPRGDVILDGGSGPLHCFWISSDQLMATLTVYQDERTVYPWARIFLTQNIAIIATIVLCALLFLVMMRRVISIPLKTLKRSIHQNEQCLGLEPGSLEGDDFDQLLSGYQNLISKTMQLREENFRQQLLVKNAQLKQLQSQINPHFLFNSLLCASSLIKAGEEGEAMEMLSHLSYYYEYLTREAADERTLLQEHMHMQDYVRVQMIRFAGRIHCEMERPPRDYENLPIPRLMLQPMVENCFSHAFKYMAADCKLSVRYAVSEGILMIHIENNGAIDEETLNALRAQPEAYGSGAEVSGLTNVHLRLRYRFGPRAGLSFARGDMGGLEVTVSIPIGAGESHG